MAKMNMSKMSSSDLSSNPLFLIFMFILVIIIFLAIFRSVSPFLTLGFGVNAHLGDLRGSFQIEAFENNMEDSTGPMFVMYYAEWCGHCKRTMPEFQKMQQQYKGNVKVVAIDSEKPENKALIQKQGIQGFPTIRYYPNGLNGTYEEYGSGRTSADFMNYLNKVSGVTATAPDNAQKVNYSN